MDIDLETAQKLIQNKGEFSYKNIKPQNRGTFLAALIALGKVAKEGSKHIANVPEGKLLDEWYLRHKLGLGGAIRNDLYVSLELWQLHDGRYQIIYYKAFGMGNYAETKSDFYSDESEAKARYDDLTANIPQLRDKILENRILTTRLEIMLYALPDDFIVVVDDDMHPLVEPYKVTRSRRAYEYSEKSRERYKWFVSPTEMYSIIRQHLEYSKLHLKKLEESYGGPIEIKDKSLAKLTVLLKSLRECKGATVMLELQPRYMWRSNDEEELYEEAMSLVARTQIADVTLIRDNLSIGQTLADKLMRRLEDEGLVSTLSEGALRRTVFVTVEDMQKREDERHAAE